MQNSFLKNILWTYVLSFSGGPLNYIVRAMLSRHTTLEEYGLIYSLLNFYLLLMMWIDLGVIETTTYFGIQYYERKDIPKLQGLIGYAAKIQILLISLFSVLVFTFSGFLAQHYFRLNCAFYIRIWLIFFIFYHLARYLSSLFNIKQEYRFSILLEPANFLIIAIILPWGLQWNDSVLGLSLVWCCAAFIVFTSFLGVHYQKNRFFFKSLPVFLTDKNQFWNYTRNVFFNNCASLLLTRLDIPLMVWCFGLKGASLYINAATLAIWGSIIIVPTSQILTMLIIKLKVNEQNLGLQGLYENIHKLFFVLLLPMSLIMTVFPKEILFLFYGEAYMSAYPILIILSIASVFMMLASLQMACLSCLGLIKERNKIMWMALFFMMLSFGAFHFFGITSLAWSYGVTYLFLFVYAHQIVKKHIDVHLNLNWLIRIVMANGMFVLSVFFLKKMFNFNFIIETLLVLILSSSCYIIAVCLSRVFTVEDWQSLCQLYRDLAQRSSMDRFEI